MRAGVNQKIEAGLADVRGIRGYTAKDSPFYAEQFCERLSAAVGTLTEHPLGNPTSRLARIARVW